MSLFQVFLLAILIAAIVLVVAIPFIEMSEVKREKKRIIKYLKENEGAEKITDESLLLHLGYESKVPTSFNQAIKELKEDGLVTVETAPTLSKEVCISMVDQN